MGRKRKEYGTIDGPMADAVKADGRRRLSLTNDERAIIARNQLIDRAVSLFLDVENSHSWDEMARELNLSMRGLKELTKSQDFIDAWNARRVELSLDPRVQAAQGAIADMVPLALKELRNLLVGVGIAPTVKLQAVKHVLAMAGIDKAPDDKSDRDAMNEFLRKNGLEPGTLTQNNIVVNNYGNDPRVQEYEELIAIDVGEGPSEDA